eukprot:COSAG05_NODE_2427_length_3074_cov_21.166723_2_plen_526_part_01
MRARTTAMHARAAACLPVAVRLGGWLAGAGSARGGVGGECVRHFPMFAARRRLRAVAYQLAASTAAEATAITLQDLSGTESSTFPDANANDSPTLLLFISPDCPVCGEVFGTLTQVVLTLGSSGCVVHVISQEGEMMAAEHKLNARTMKGVCIPHHEDVPFPLLDDSELKLSLRYEPDTLPAAILLAANGVELARSVGWERSRWQACVAAAVEACGAGVAAAGGGVDWEALPEHMEGCGSKAHLLDAEGGMSSRRITVAEEDDEQEFMHAAGFTDGFPVVPPTPQRVARMLKQGTFRDPAELVALVPPLMGPATIEKIAINAVMAGVPPSAFCLVLTALEAICTEDFNCHGVWATTMAATAAIIVNGPVREHAAITSGQNSLGRGAENRANLAVGRAVRLVVQNIGGAKPGFSEMATLGSPLKLGLTFGEWEERASTWTPLHVERGFSAEDSVVTCIALTGMTMLIDQTSRTASQLAGTFASILSTSWSRRSSRLLDARQYIRIHLLAKVETVLVGADQHFLEAAI